MKPGLQSGQEAAIELIVTPEMVARFGARTVHAVYGTAAMVAHMEEVGRMLLEPYLEADEEAVGYAIDVRHNAVTPVGAVVRVRARLLEVQGPRIICSVEAENAVESVGSGIFTQWVIPKAQLQARITEATAQLAVGRFATKE